MTEVLLSPWTWRLVSSQLPRECSPVTDRHHERWSRQNPDRHPHREVLVGLSGSCLYGYRQKLYRCAPGTVFLFEELAEHDNHYAPQSDGVCHLWLYLVQDDIFYALLRVENGTINRFAHERLNAPDVENLLRQSWSALAGATPGPAELGRARVVAALASVAARVVELDCTAVPVAANRGSQAQMVESVKKHIRHTAGKGLTLDNLALIAGYSKFHFLRVFRKHAGQSVHRYINVCRLERAEELGRQGLLKKQVAEELGFSCLAAYSRWRKQYLADT